MPSSRTRLSPYARPSCPYGPFIRSSPPPPVAVDPIYTSLKAVSEAGESLLTDQLETNLASFLTWGLVNIGGFLSVARSDAGPYGGDMSQLRMSIDPRYGNIPGKIWEGFRSDWVHETGVSCDRQPTRVSGVYVDGAFHPIGETGAYSHSIDYRNGRVVFDTPISATGVVQCEYSFRLYHVSTADTPWWQQIQPDSFRNDDPTFMQSSSGAWSILAENRVQLPHVVIESPPRFTGHVPKEIGNSSVWGRQDVLFHILAEDRGQMKFLHDVVIAQIDKILLAFDKNLALGNDAFPLAPNGDINPTGLTYPQMVAAYAYQKYLFRQAASVPVQNRPPLYVADVRMNMEAEIF